MRTQFLYVGLLSMTLAGGLVSAGCDSIHTGQPSDPSGPVKLVRIMIQDDDTLASTGRSVATDLLDTQGSPLSTAVVCNDNTDPCIPQFNYNLGASLTPPWACVSNVPSGNGVCFDPLQPGAAATGVQIQEPATAGAPFTVSGTEIRLVFNKQLTVGTIETITHVDGQPPGSDEMYALNPGVAELDGPDGVAIDATEYYDGAGSPYSTSDIILNPFGPAIVIKPNHSLKASTTYTIVLHSDKIADRKGNKLADLNGNVVLGNYSKPFTTEGFLAVVASPDFTNSVAIEKINNGDTSPLPPVLIAPDDVFEVTFNSDVADVKTVNLAITSAPTGVIPGNLVSYFATIVTQNADGTNQCTVDGNTPSGAGIIDYSLTDGAGNQIPWPVGDYVVTAPFPLFLNAGDGTDLAYAATTTPTTPTSFSFTVSADTSKVKHTNPLATHPLTCPANP